MSADPREYAPQGYYDPIETDAGIVDADDPRTADDREAFAAELEAEYAQAIENRWADTYEAILGARLRFHAPHETYDQAGRTYKRWSQLYHSDHAEALRAVILAAGR